MLKNTLKYHIHICKWYTYKYKYIVKCIKHTNTFTKQFVINTINIIIIVIIVKKYWNIEILKICINEIKHAFAKLVINIKITYI